MRYRRMGNSGLLVSELCLGTNTFGGADLAVPTWKTLGGLDTTIAKEIVKAAIDGGVNFIDRDALEGRGVSRQGRRPLVAMLLVAPATFFGRYQFAGNGAECRLPLGE